jgi:hypothetical protein
MRISLFATCQLMASASKIEGKRMSSTADVFLKATLLGVGGTIVLDLYAAF